MMTQRTARPTTGSTTAPSVVARRSSVTSTVALLLTALLLASTTAAQDEYEPRRAQRATANEPRPSTRTPAADAGPPVQPLPREHHELGLAAAPGTVTALGPLPSAPQARPIALVGGTVHTVSGATLEDGCVLFEHGVITRVGDDVTLPIEARRIDVAGMHVYPSFIAANTVLGLAEISAVRATRDDTEVGDINPNVRSAIGVNPSSELIPVTRSNGILVAMSAPRGELISGTAAVLQLDGWTTEDMTVLASAALVIRWPGMRLNHRPDAKPPLAEQRKRRDARIELLRDAFASARAYAEGIGNAPAGRSEADRDVKWEAMIAAIERRIPVLIETDDILEIRAAVEFAEQQNLRLVLAAGRDVALVRDELARKEIPVIYESTLTVGRSWEPYDVQFSIPRELATAGVLFAISRGSNTFAAPHTRDLPYDAGKAMAFGLDRASAIAALTLNPAKILGVDGRLGSLDVGKDATLFVCDGDPLDVRTNVHLAFIQGREVDLTDRHKRLYERYRMRPRPAAEQR